MHSLPSSKSRAPTSYSIPVAPSRVRRLLRTASVVALMAGATACGDDKDGNGALADSGTARSLFQGTLEIPTTVAVRDDVAWVAESQLDHYVPLKGTGVPNPFRLVGVPLTGGGAVTEIALPPNFFPEGVTSKGGVIFVGSIADGSILAVEKDGTEAGEFVGPDVLDNSVLGMTVDNNGKMLWVCNSDAINATADVVGIEIGTGEVQVRHELPASRSADVKGAGSLCNDLVMSPNGTLWITESFGGRLFRIDASKLLTENSAVEWLQDNKLAGDGTDDNAFGVNGITLLGGRLFVVNTAFGTLFSIDPTLDEPTGDDLKLVTLTEDGNDLELSKPDGITRLSDTELLIVENGLGTSGGKRVVRASLNSR
jgi:outer membrane protein assembly factor BamB